MKTYKLIKVYPGSPGLGYIGIYSDNPLEDKASIYFLKVVPKFHPEFWEEIVEKEYEILSFIHNGDYGVPEETIISIKNYRLDSDIQFLRQGHYIDSSCWNIYSIKRLSDRETFTVGDKILIKIFNLI